jgi:hypothetical protein
LSAVANSRRTNIGEVASYCRLLGRVSWLRLRPPNSALVAEWIVVDRRQRHVGKIRLMVDRHQ